MFCCARDRSDREGWSLVYPGRYMYVDMLEQKAFILAEKKPAAH